MADNYKLIESAKERAINRTNKTIEYGVSDVVVIMKLLLAMKCM